MNKISSIVNDIFVRKKISRHFTIIVICLSVLVTYAVSSMLIMPAESVNGKLICDITEHVHSDECYELVCTQNALKQTEISLLESISQTSAQTTADITSETTETTVTTEVVTSQTTLAEVTDKSQISETALLSETSEIAVIASEETTDISATESQTETTVSETSVPDTVTSEVSVTETTTAHVHTDECYELICQFEYHVHSDKCYEGGEGIENINLPGFSHNLAGRPLLNDIVTANIASDLIDGGVYKIKNKHSGLYIDVNIDKDRDIQQAEYTGERNHFTLIKAEGDYWYICTQFKANSTTMYTLDADVTNGDIDAYNLKSTNNNNQKFKIVKNDDGTYSMLIKYFDDQRCIEVKDWSKEVGGDITYYNCETNDGVMKNDNQKFYLEPVVETTDENIKIEARVIFGDYNDDGTHEYADVNPKLQLRYRLGNSFPHNVDGQVQANLVVDNTSARKDWCYQYKYTWEVPKLADGESTGYYVNIDFEGKENYNIYYLPEKYFGSPGNTDIPKKFKDSEQQTFFNEDGVIYIFLDPKVDWSCPVYDDGTVKPNNFNLTMKKRWDGHNQGSLKQIAHHKNEKIQIQLQRRNDNGEFEEYKEPTYYNYHYYTNEDGNFVDSREVIFSKDISKENRYQITFGDETIDYQDQNGNYIDKNSLATATVSPPKEYRLKIYYGYDRWNNVVLTLNGDNLPTHFTNGYYYIWNDLPYGMYRVIETKSFIDVNDNDRFDNEDIDTSSEYYYMTYPPARDSRGVLHIQNFTNEMKLSVHKEWYGDEDGKSYLPYDDIIGNSFFDPEVRVALYRSTKSGVPVASGDGYTVNGEKLDYIWDTTINGSQKVDIPSSFLEMYSDKDEKYYYYIREMTDATYRCINANEAGFVKAPNGNYGVPYDEGPENRAFVIKNTPEMQIVVNKQWLKHEDSSAEGVIMDSEVLAKANYNPEIEFEVYRSKTQLSVLNNSFEEKKYSYKKEGDSGIDFASIVSSLEKMKNVDEIDYFVTSNQTFTLTKDNCIDFDTYYVDTDNTIKPYYYYIKEKNTDNYLHAIYNNNTGIYHGSDGKTVLIQNVPEMHFEVEKVWYKEDGTIDTNNKDEVTFYVLRSHNNTSGDKDKDITKDDGTDGISKEYKRGPFTTKNLKFTLPTYDSFYVPYRKSGGKITGEYYYYIVEVMKEGETYRKIKDSDAYKIMPSVYGTTTADWWLNPISFTKQGTIKLCNEPNDNIESLTIDVTKKWYVSSNGAEIPNATINMPVKFELYRSTTLGIPAEYDGVFRLNDKNGPVLEQITNSTFTIDETGQATVNSALLKKKDDSGNKYYYYIREVQSENFDCINDDANNLGFVHNDSNVYGIAYSDDSTLISFTIKNVPEIKIKVDKKWLDSDGNVDTENKNEMKFVLLRASADYGQNLSISTDNKGGYYVTDTDKTFKTIGTFTTNDLSKTLTITDSEDIAPYKINSGAIQKLYFYVLEINGDNYNTDNYTVRVLNQAVSWDKDKDYASISVINMPNLSLNLEKQWEGNPEISGVNVTLYRSTDRTKAPQNSIIKDSQTAVERSTVTFEANSGHNSYKDYNYRTAYFTKEIPLANNNVEKVVVKIPTDTGYPYVIVHLNDYEYIKVGRYNGGGFVYESNATQMPTGSFSISNGYLEVDCTKLQQGVEDAIYIQNASGDAGEYEITIYYQTDTVSSSRSLLVDENIDVSSATVETVGTYTLTSSENWQKTISNLPVCDANYAPYYYWIVEESIDSSIESVSYRFVDNDPDTVYCVNAMSPGSSATLIVKNKLKVILPETGSSGTTNYYIIGGILLTVGLLSRCFIKRKA